MAFPKINYTMSDDVTIAYQVWGDGPIDIVMVPPIVNHLEHLLELDEYVQFMRRLSSFAKVITFDKRGQGMSDYPDPTKNSLETRMDDIRAVMDAVQSDKAVIFGSSEGGPISIMFAATYPHRTSALILYGTFAKFVKTEDFPNSPFDQHTLEDMVPLLLRKWGTGIMTHFLASSFDQNPEKLEWLAKLERLANAPGAFKTVLKLNADINVYPLLETLNVPTLILHKKNDTGVAFASGYDLHKKIPGSVFVELQGCDHLPYVDDSSKFINEVEKFLTGQESSSPITERVLPTGRVLSTVLFTDIANSTLKASELGDHKWKEMLDIHDRISQEQIKFYRGILVKSTGDGLLATFDGPGRAIMCAKKMKDQLLKAGIEIRAGLHTGEIELRDQDIGGISVHIASRIESKAKPGEILVSRTVTDLVAGSGIEFEESGIHQLKGIEEDWPLFKVI